MLATGVAATTTGDGATREADFWVGSLLAVGTFVSIGELRSGDSFGVCVCARAASPCAPRASFRNGRAKAERERRRQWLPR